ncbi:MAG: dipicolinate synthase subunit DpsA, partial [Bacilli bacterium]
MLTGIQVAIIGGDARQLEVIKRCVEMDANVMLIGFENLQSEFSGANKRTLEPETVKNIDALVLPIVGTDEQGFVESIFSFTPLQLTDEIIAALPKKVQVYTGIAKPYLSTLMKKYNIPYIEMLSLDDVAIYNSIPTVEGALMMAIQHTDITIHGSHSVVLGMGRVGMTLARTLSNLGANV